MNTIIFIDASRKNVNQQFGTVKRGIYKRPVELKGLYIYIYVCIYFYILVYIYTQNHFGKTVGACHHHLSGKSGACHHYLTGLCPVLTAPHMHDYCGSCGKLYPPLPHLSPFPLSVAAGGRRQAAGSRRQPHTRLSVISQISSLLFCFSPLYTQATFLSKALTIL